MNLTALTGALVYDGTGTPPEKRDLLLRGSKIEAAVPAGSLNLTGIPRKDFTGLALAPGFLDAHGHSDLSILAAPEAFGKISQGITTEIIGNCGLSVFPILTGEVREHLQSIYAAYQVPITWKDLNSYAAELERRKPAIHLASLCGHNTLRANICGYRNRNLTDSGLAEMRRILENELKQGAAGLSTGLLYTPGKFAEKQELLSLAEILKRHHALYATHLRSEGDQLTEAIQEALELAECGSGRLQISHLKTALPRNWHKLDSVFALLETAKKRGLEITADRYPYIRSQTSLSVILPPPYDAMDDVSIRDTLRENPRAALALQEQLARSGRRWDDILLTSTNHSGYADFFGKSLQEIAEALRKSPPELCVELMRHDAPGTMAAFAGMSADNLARILEKEWVCAGTDESARPQDDSIGRSHPRGFGTMPEFLRMVAAKTSMQEAVRRITSLPASIFRLRGKGVIRSGYDADLVIFSEPDLNAGATFARPHEPAEGIHCVYVSGEPAYRPGGKILRRNGSFLRITPE